MTRVRLVIRGRVQGVWFRASAQDEARVLGLAGWVRNRPDGAVEALAEGDDPAVERFVRWCHDGPPAARVSDVEIDRLAPRGDLRSFDVV